MAVAYYNDNDPHCAQWLRNLIAAGEIPDGVVDERPVQEVRAEDVEQYTHVHLFAGIGGWPFAVRLAGWPDERPIWTGSCPCQPYSVIGKHEADRDPNNLWPEFRRLVWQCRPANLAGEQVASRAGREWLDGVRADLEAMGYAVGAADLCAAGVGAPHIRQRLWFVARRNEWQRVVFAADCDEDGLCPVCAVDYAECTCIGPTEDDCEYREAAGVLYARRLGDAREPGLERHPGDVATGSEPGRLDTNAGRSTAEAGCHSWDDAIWLACADQKARRAQPGTLPVVDGFPGRVEQLRGYGNAIVPQVAAQVLRGFMEC